MYPDFLHNLILTLDTSWIVIAIGYAIFDYIFNIVVCSIIGGTTNISKFAKGKSKLLTTRKFIKEALNKYKIGSRKQIKEFQMDKLSWLWPLTSVFIPVYIYGTTKELTLLGITSLTNSGVNAGDYLLLPSENWIQISLWIVAILLSIRSFYRYQKERSKPTWFSRVWVFSFSRLVLFNTPLSYMILSIIYTWVQYSTFLFNVLASDHIQYTILHPDLMYGLGKVYNTVIIMGTSLIVLSLMPAFMFIREKKEKYNQMYLVLMYSGVITLFFMLGILVSRFDERLSNIQQGALSNFQSELSSNSISEIKKVADIQYFSLVSNLPGGFPIPSWLGFLLSARFTVFFFEAIKFIAPSIIKKSNLFNFAQKILLK